MTNSKITQDFRRLDIDARSYFLDTNVWSSLASSPNCLNNFLPWLKTNNAIAALSSFTMFELSRVSQLHQTIDNLLTAAASRIYIPLFYDELSDLEMLNYPNDVELLWCPITNFVENSNAIFLSTISKDPRFVNKRQEFLDFGYTKFMNLEAFKKNFPLEDENGKYSEDNAELFAWATTLDFLLRYFPNVLLPFKGNLKAFDTSKLKSLYLRGQFLYFKYYVHGQSPDKSDFMDFAHTCYLPYVDAYVTERNVLNVLSHMKSAGKKLPKCELLHVRSFVEDVERLGM